MGWAQAALQDANFDRSTSSDSVNGRTRSAGSTEGSGHTIGDPLTPGGYGEGVRCGQSAEGGRHRSARRVTSRRRSQTPSSDWGDYGTLPDRQGGTRFRQR